MQSSGLKGVAMMLLSIFGSQLLADMHAAWVLAAC